MARFPVVALLLLLLATAAFADSADLVLLPQSARQFSSTLALVNWGPDVARNVVLTIDVPAGLAIERFNVIDGCDSTQRPIRCSLGDLEVNKPRYLGVDYTAPIANARYTVTYTASSDTPDGNAANNAAVFNWETKIEADLAAFIFQDTVRIDPGESAQFRAFFGNNLEGNLPPTNVRIEYTTTNAIIESVSPPQGVVCTTELAERASCFVEKLVGNEFNPTQVRIRASSNRLGGQAALTMHVSSDLPETRTTNDTVTSSVPVYRWIAVTSANDNGAGSLRDAIMTANANCTPGPCRIVFEIPAPVPSEGWFTIVPSTPLPDITADRVTLEGQRQTAFTGDTNPGGPEIAIDGRFAHRGLKMLSRCEGIVQGLAIGNFDEDQGLWFASRGDCGVQFPDRREVRANFIGVDPSGKVPWPNLRGLRADDAAVNVDGNTIAHNRFSGIWMWRGGLSAHENRIESNGASGIFLGPEVLAAEIVRNTISDHLQMGVAVARGAQLVDIRENSMKHNGGLGIDWGLDGVSPSDADDHDAASNAPVLINAIYNASSNTTRITGVLQSTPLGPYINTGLIDLYANDTPDGDGEQFIGAMTAPDAGPTFTITLPGDYRGKWINATWTRVHWYASRPPDIHADSYAGGQAMTSELSNALLVTN